MALAPQLHPAHRFRAAEVIAVAVPTQPPSLAGGLAGLPTGGLGTVPLTIRSPWIRKKKLIATAAFAAVLRAAHRDPNLRRTTREENEKEDRKEDPNPKKEEEL
jgi:hypothetical protein